MLHLLPRQRLSACLRHPLSPRRPLRRPLTSAPNPNSGPLLSRRADRALPIIRPSWHIWAKSLPIFAAIMIVSSLAIFNYEKQHSGVVTGTMYALRTNPHARELLGDEVTFAHGVPWIRGEINQVQGRVDIGLWVKGSRQTAWMRFRSRRWKRMGTFETLEWSLEFDGGEKVSLMEPGTEPVRAVVDEGPVATIKS